MKNISFQIIFAGIAWLTSVSWIDSSVHVATFNETQRNRHTCSTSHQISSVIMDATWIQGDTLDPKKAATMKKPETKKATGKGKPAKAGNTGSTGTHSKGEGAENQNSGKGNTQASAGANSPRQSSGTTQKTESVSSGTSGKSAGSQNTNKSKGVNSVNSNAEDKTRQGSTGTNTTGEGNKGQGTEARAKQDSINLSKAGAKEQTTEDVSAKEPVKGGAAVVDSTKQETTTTGPNQTLPADSTRSLESMGEGSTGTHSTGERGSEGGGKPKRKGG